LLSDRAPHGGVSGATPHAKPACICWSRSDSLGALL